MNFNQNGKLYAYEPATGNFGEVEPGEPVDMTNPRMVEKPLVGGRPSQLMLEVTQQCNLRCTYCPHTHQGIPGVRPHRDVHMSWEIAQMAMLQVEERGADDIVICFYGGEPLLNFRLIKAVVEKWPQYRYDIDTNGQAVTNEIAEWAARFDIGWQISVDGGVFITDRYRGNGAHKGALDAVFEIQRAKQGVDVRLALTLAPPWELGAAAKLIQRYKELHFTVNFADLTGSPIKPEPLDLGEYRTWYVHQCKSGDREMVPRLVRQLFEPALIRFYHRKKNQQFDTWVPGGCCNPAVRRLHVSATGELFPCEKVQTGFQIGDVWSGVDWSNIQKMHNKFYVERLKQGCAECEILRLCAGCWLSPVDCEAEKAHWLGVMKMFAELVEADAAGWLKDTVQT